MCSSTEQRKGVHNGQHQATPTVLQGDSAVVPGPSRVLPFGPHRNHRRRVRRLGRRADQPSRFLQPIAAHNPETPPTTGGVSGAFSDTQDRPARKPRRRHTRSGTVGVSPGPVGFGRCVGAQTRQRGPPAGDPQSNFSGQTLVNQEPNNRVGEPRRCGPRGFLLPREVARNPHR